MANISHFEYQYMETSVRAPYPIEFNKKNKKSNNKKKNIYLKYMINKRK